MGTKESVCYPDGNNGSCPVRHVRICVSLVILVMTVTVKFLRTQSLFTDFHSHCCILYCPFILPRPTDQTAFARYLTTLFWTCFDVDCCIHGMCFCGCGYPPPNENMWQIWSNDGGKNERRYLYIYSLFTPIHNVGQLYTQSSITKNWILWWEIFSKLQCKNAQSDKRKTLFEALLIPPTLFIPKAHI